MSTYKIRVGDFMQELLQPIFLKPYLKKTIWGGQNLKNRFNKYKDNIDIGESWEISGLKVNSSIVANGPFRGVTLYKVINLFPFEILGEGFMGTEELPLLCKIIDANDRLSVQVHPNDKYAFEKENGKRGKAEIWYIIDAKKDAFIILGLKPGISKNEFLCQCKNLSNIKRLLNYVPVKKGEMYYIPPGTIHAIGEGIIIAEIQQSSDLTYRLYDWDRVDKDGYPRELHMNKALDVVDFTEKKYKFNKEIDNEFLKVKLVELENDEINLETFSMSFHAVMVVEGQGEIVWGLGKERIAPGQSILIPALLNKYQIKGNCKFLLAKPSINVEATTYKCAN